MDVKNCNLIEEKISKLDNQIKSLIYNEKHIMVKILKKERIYMYNIFLNKLDDIDNMIKLIDNLSIEDKKKFLEELIKKCEFKKEEFYSNFENKKIKLLCDLK